MCDKCYAKSGPRHFDARTGGAVDCLPASRKPHVAIHAGYSAVAACPVGLADAMRDHAAWMNVRHLMPEDTGCLTTR